MKSIHSYCQILMLFLLCAIPLQLAAGGLGQPASSELEFPFYGQSLCAATLDAVKVKSVRDNDVFQAWREYQKRDVTPAISSLQALSEQMGLNDWFVFQLVRDYVDGLLCDASPTDRVLLEHLLLVKMGYDVRLARTERQLLLLVPFDQEVYEHSFIRIGNKDYYLFFDALKADLDERLYRMYDRIEETETLLIDARARKRAIEADKVRGNNIYRILTHFDKLYDVMSESERQELMQALIAEIQINEEPLPNGQWIKSIRFRLPIIDEDTVLTLDKCDGVGTALSLIRAS